MTQRAGVGWLTLAAALAACAPTPRPASTVAAGPVCQVGPDGGPVVAERGIGGTGAPTRIAERGIGGTGIVGVVTGFASICLAGHEVALPADVPIEIGGAASNQQALRAGQVAAVEAAGPADALYARRVTVRYEVEGPIEMIAPDRLQVAGQIVLLSPETWLRTAPALGQWVAVSGLRDPTGAIAATRLDLVSTRTFLVHGVVQQVEGGYRIGTLPVVAGPDVLVPGLPVSITGVYDEGILRAASVAPDLLASDPVAYFGGYTSSFILEGFAGPGERPPYLGTLPLSQAPASSRPIGPGRSVIEFQRTDGGGMRINSLVPSAATSIRPGLAPGGAGPAGDRFQQAPTSSRDGPGRGAGAAQSFEPAPMPNRSLGFGAAPDGSDRGNRFGDGGRGGQGLRPQPGTGAAGGANPPIPGLDPSAIRRR